MHSIYAYSLEQTKMQATYYATWKHAECQYHATSLLWITYLERPSSYSAQLPLHPVVRVVIAALSFHSR